MGCILSSKQSTPVSDPSVPPPPQPVPAKVTTSEPLNPPIAPAPSNVVVDQKKSVTPSAVASVSTTTTTSAPSSTPNPPVPFAVMRNSHESIRKGIQATKTAVEAGNMDVVKQLWTDLRRAIKVHMDMEELDMFPLMDLVSDNQFKEGKMSEEHVAEHHLADEITASFENGSFSSETFMKWVELHLEHLSHEEKLMMPLTMKTGATPEERRMAVHTKLVNPAYTRNKEEFLWYINWCVRMLNEYGSTQNPPEVAVRVFAHAFQVTCSPDQWAEISVVVKSGCSQAIWDMMVQDYHLDQPGKVAA